MNGLWNQILVSRDAFLLESLAPYVDDEILERLQREGLLARQGERIFLTDRGIDVSNCVLAEFLLEEEG